MNEDIKLMERAIDLALMAEREGNLPVGALITLNGVILAEGRSAIWKPKFDATRHAEMEALRAVAQDRWQAPGLMAVYTTLEPCLMCFGSIVLHGVGRVVFGSSDPYGGAGASFGHLPAFFQEGLEKLEWAGPIMPEECDPLLERLHKLESFGR